MESVRFFESRNLNKVFLPTDEHFQPEHFHLETIAQLTVIFVNISH